MKKIHFLLLIISLFFITSNLYGQEWGWVKYGSGGQVINQSAGTSITDYNGNTYLFGTFENSIEFDNILLESKGNSDIYLVKYDSAGTLIWVKDFGGPGDDYATNLILDRDQNIVLTGSAGRDAVFESDTLNSSCGRNLYILKIDSAGDVIFVRNDFDIDGCPSSNAIEVDIYNNILVTGDSGGGSLGMGGGITIKVNSLGDVLWTDLIESSCHTNGIKGTSISADGLGNIYVAGIFECDEIQIQNNTVEASIGIGRYLFVVKYDPFGKVIWTQSATGSVFSVNIDHDLENNLLLTGIYPRDLSFGNSTLIDNTDIPELYGYISKLSSLGEWLWAKNTNELKYTPMDILTDANGNLYVTGYEYVFQDQEKAVVESYSFDGIYLWSQIRDRTNRDVTRAFSIDIDGAGNAYICGLSSGSFIPEYPFIGTGTELYVAKINTNLDINILPPTPICQSQYSLCEKNESLTIDADGMEIKWYNDVEHSELLFSGNSYISSYISTDTIYVTQTIDNKESKSRAIVVQVSELQDLEIREENDTLFAPLGPFEYSWYTYDKKFRGNEYYLVPDTSGIYTVHISDGFCTPKEVFFDFQKSIDDLPDSSLITNIIMDEEPKISIFPNPVSKFIFLQVDDPAKIQLIMIFDALGKKHFQAEEYQESIDLRNLNNGPYFIRISLRNGKYINKVMFKI